jgi:Ca2+-transporting ATPase
MNPSLDVDARNLPGLTFLGFIAIVDAIRPEVEESVLTAKKAGMQVVMITGDHVETAKSIASKVGIFSNGDRVLSGKEMSEMSDEDIISILDNTTVFARVTPKDKLRIIEMYKKKGDTIAMTGDGVNDALSLVAADLGVAMGKMGTEVAREAADIVLLDDKFGNIIEAAEEGRNIYWTIRKSILYLLSTNIGELFVIVIAVIIGMPLPLVAAQIIWLNLVTDTFLVAAIAVDPKEEGLLNEKFKKPSKYLVDWFMGLRIILLGGVMTIITLVMFNHYFESDFVKATTIALTILTIFQWYNIFNIRSHKNTIFSKKLFNNKYLIGALFLTIGLHLFAIYNPFMQKILQTTGLSLSEWIVMIIVGFSIVLVEELRKLIYKIYIKNKLSKTIS